MEAILTFFHEGSDWNIIQYMNYAIFITAIMIMIGYLIGYQVSLYGRYGDTMKICSVNPKAAWFIQELPSVIIPLCCLFHIGGDQINGEVNPNMVLLGMFLMHYIQRTFIFSLCIQGGKPTPSPTLLVAFIFCSTNGYLQGRTLTHFHQYDTSWFWSPQFIIGHILFLVGMAINIHSDSILRNLRKHGETGYKIPKGGMFEYVSGANFFGECLEWSGYALACSSISAVAFAVLTTSFVGVRAIQHHKYYKTKFEDYPKTRKAFIPFII